MKSFNVSSPPPTAPHLLLRAPFFLSNDTFKNALCSIVTNQAKRVLIFLPSRPIFVSFMLDIHTFRPICKSENALVYESCEIGSWERKVKVLEFVLMLTELQQ